MTIQLQILLLSFVDIVGEIIEVIVVIYSFAEEREFLMIIPKYQGIANLPNSIALMATVSLLTPKFEISFQSFVVAIHHWQMKQRLRRLSDLNYDALKEFVECNPHKSSQ